MIASAESDPEAMSQQFELFKDATCEGRTDTRVRYDCRSLADSEQ